MLQVARTIGMGMARIAEANRELIVRTLMQPGDTERDLALRFAAAAEHMMPLVGPTLEYALQAHMLEQVRRDVIGAADLASGEIGGTVDLAVCFADLVEFTRLGEEIAPEELGSVAGRFEEMASAVVEPPVRLVKMIGDAAMLVSSRARADAEAALRLIEAADEEGEEFPFLRAGMACGPTLPRRGTTTAARSTWRAGSPQSPGPAACWSTPRPRRQSTGLSPTPSPASAASRASTPGQAVPRPPQARAALGRLAAGDQQVVEELGREAGLEQAGVDLLQGDVAAEGEVSPLPGDRFGLGARLDRAQAPAPGVGEQLLAADVAPLEAGCAAAGGAGRRGRRRGRRPLPRARGRWTARPPATSARPAPTSPRQAGAATGRSASAAQPAGRHSGRARRRRRSRRRAAAPAGTRRRLGRGRGCGGGRRGRRRCRSSRPRRAAPRPRWRPSRPPAQAPRRCVESRCSIPGEMSVAVSRSITPSCSRLSEK